MKPVIIKLILFLLIGIMPLQLASCSSPQKYLPVDASILKKDMTRDEVEKLVGVPDAITVNEAGDEEWFYYNEHTHFWQDIPLIGRFLGSREVETLMITLRDAKVVKWVYYVEKL